jgi:hypothetical protein
MRMTLVPAGLLLALSASASGCSEPVAESTEANESALSAAPAPCGRINPGQSLGPGSHIESCNGWYSLRVGNHPRFSVHIVGTWAGASPHWGLVNTPDTRLLNMNGDGRLVVSGWNWQPALHPGTQQPIFATVPYGAGSFATLTDQGQLVVQSADGVVRWPAP